MQKKKKPIIGYIHTEDKGKNLLELQSASYSLCLAINWIAKKNNKCGVLNCF
jgi:hypothetical protein